MDSQNQQPIKKVIQSLLSKKGKKSKPDAQSENLDTAEDNFSNAQGKQCLNASLCVWGILLFLVATTIPVQAQSIQIDGTSSLEEGEAVIIANGGPGMDPPPIEEEMSTEVIV
jgi:hypothetical protein